MLPLSLFRNPVIGLSSLAVFVLGMFGVIIYLRLFIKAPSEFPPRSRAIC